MKIWTSEHVFQHPWETIAQAAWRKYPNPMNPSVTALDVVDRQVDDSGVLHSVRLMTTKWGIPGWVQAFVHISDELFAKEYSTVDPKEKTMVLKSQNLTLCNIISINEQLVYKQHPQHPDKTVLSQEATINIRGIPMTDYLENMVKSTCSNNAVKGRQAMEWVVNIIKEETQSLSKTAEEQFQSFSVSAEEQLHNLTKAAEKATADFQIKNSFIPRTRGL